MIHDRAGPILATAALALAAYWAAAGQAHAGSAAGADPVAARSLDRSPEKVRDFWTERRMRRAEPLDIVVDRRTGRVTRATTEPGGASTPQPTSHIDYTSSEVADTTSFPNRTNGKVFFHDPSDGNYYVCSGTAIDSANRSVVFTAGHCVFYGQFADQWAFVPGYHDGDAPFGIWAAKELSALSGWTSSFDCPFLVDDCPNFDYDVGAAVVGENGGQDLEDVLGGARPIAFNQPRNQTYDAFGYPAASPFDGELLWMCESPYGGDDVPDPRGGPAPIRIGCDMTGGSSGGGWIAGGSRVSHNDYGYFAEPEHMYGPYYGDDAQALYEAASGTATTPPQPQPEPQSQPPDTRLLRHPKKKSRKRKARFAFATTDGSLAAFECSLDDEPWESCSSGSVTYRKLRRRMHHRFTVRARNAVGQADPTPAKFGFKVKGRR